MSNIPLRVNLQMLYRWSQFEHENCQLCKGPVGYGALAEVYTPPPERSKDHQTEAEAFQAADDYCNALADRQEKVLAKIRQLIGGEPRSAIVLDTSDAIGSKILAVEFAALCADHYPCVVLQTVGNVIYPRQKLLKYRDAGMGFDGFTWETADPVYSFSWDSLRFPAEPSDSSREQIFVPSDRPEERDREQLGA
jgi:hypothetical protein